MIIITDVNILLSALIRDSTTREIIVKSGQDFCFPEISFHKIRKYKELILTKSGISESEFLIILNTLFRFIRLIPTEELTAYWNEAKRIMGHIDPEDVPFIAAALSQEHSIIWSDDKHFAKQDKVIILCSGMPSVPSKGPLLEFFAKKGYWVFYPRYRGTWESSGRFLKYSLEKDVLDVIDELPRGFKDAYSGRKYRIKHPEIYLVGSSFGGPAAILASRDKRVRKAILISAIVDWTVPSRLERLSWVWKFWREAFGEAIRFSKKDWDKLEKGNFYNPVRHIHEIDGKKLFFIHAKDDRIVTFGPVAKFAKKVGAALLPLKKGGHFGLGILAEPVTYKRIRKFLAS